MAILLAIEMAICITYFLTPHAMLTCFDFRKRCYFVDLFVRVSNKVATDMYHRLGYSVYRRVLEYYSGEVDEDAFGKNKGSTQLELGVSLSDNRGTF